MTTSCGSREVADLVVHNATIYTVDDNFSTQQAFAVRDGKICEIGAEHQILNKYSTTRSYDARGKFIYPGFIDAHCHFLGYGRSLQRVNLVGTKSYDEVLERTLAFVKESRGEWILGRGWDQNDWSEKTFPTKTKLDSLFPDRPVALRRIDGHAALVNQVALDKAGITVDTKIDGGDFEQIDGQLTGILIDNAYDLVETVIPPPSSTEDTKALLDAQRNCFEVGLTGISDAGLLRPNIELIQELQEVGELKMRIYAMLSDTKENLDHYLAHGPIETDRLTVRSFKFYADGALGSRGACLLEPYADAETSGFLLNDVEHFRKYAEILNSAGFQMNTHCIGDSAVRLILDIYGEALKGTNDKRWRIEHAQIVHPDDLEKFKKFNVIPSVQPTHATSDMYWAGKRIGPEREKTAYAFKSLLDQNGSIPLGTDFPVESIDPLLTFYAAVSRKDTSGFPEGGYQMENSLSRKETLQGMTIWAALSNFQEQEQGSLEVGKRADFVVLNGDLMTVPEELIPKLKVLATFVDGEQVF